MTWVSGPRAEIDQVRRALAVFLGLPKAPDYVGPNCRRKVPETYAPGAKGWSDTPVRVVDSDDGESAIEVPEDLAKKVQGWTIAVKGQPVALDFESGAAELHPKFFRDGVLRERSPAAARVTPGEIRETTRLETPGKR